MKNKNYSYKIMSSGHARAGDGGGGGGAQQSDFVRACVVVRVLYHVTITTIIAKPSCWFWH